MQSNAQKLWIPNPSAASLVDLEALYGAGNGFDGEIRIVDQISILASSVTRCQKVCASPCQPNVWTIEFADVDFGDCNACGKSLGFTVLLDRNPDFDNQTYFEYNQRKQYVYQGNLTGVVTGIELAQWFYEYIIGLQNENDQHDQFLVEATDPAGTAVLELTFPCSGLIAYNVLGIYHLPNNNLTNIELPTFTETQEAVEAVLSREKLLQQFPQEVGHVFGEAPRDQFMWCQNICVITLKGCIPACSDFFDNQNSGHLHTGATPFDLMLYVNSAAPGFADFIGALNTLFPATCGTPGLTLAPGIQAGVIGLYNTLSGLPNVGGTAFTDAELAVLGLDGTEDVNLIVTAGGARFVVTASTLLELETEINNYIAGSATYAAGVFTFNTGVPPLVNEFAAPDQYVSIVPFNYVNYAGE